MSELEIHQSTLPYVDPARKIAPTGIVLHWWGEWDGMPSEDQGVKTLVDVLSARQMSVQYGVLRNGDIHLLTPTDDTWARHAKDANDSTIGIEIEGRNAEELDNNQAQYLSVIALAKKLKADHPIADDFSVEQLPEGGIRVHGVTSHKQIDLFCASPNGKEDVHDAYLARVVADLRQ